MNLKPELSIKMQDSPSTSDENHKEDSYVDRAPNIARKRQDMLLMLRVLAHYFLVNFLLVENIHGIKLNLVLNKVFIVLQYPYSKIYIQCEES